MKYDVLYNFISPVTGRVLSDQNYVLYGNRLGIAMPSPIIIDIRLDLINLRKDFSELKKDYKFSSDATFVLNTPNTKLPNAQALNMLTGSIPRILKANTDGIVEVAIKDTDYATVIRLEQLASDAAFSATAAGGSATAAAASAKVAEGFATAAGASATKAEVAAGEATTAAGLATKAAETVTGITKGVAASVVFVTNLAVAAEAAAEKAENAAESAAESAALVKNAGIKVIVRETTAVAGAAGAAGITTLLIDSNLDLNGSRLKNISSSPEGDYDAINAQFALNLLNDNVEIIWEKR